MIMYWENYDTPQVIEPNFHVSKDMTSLEQWSTFVQLKAQELKLPKLHEDVLMYYTTLYYTNLGLKSPMVDKYIALKLDIRIKELYELSLKKDSEDEQKRDFWNRLLSLVSSDLMFSFEKTAFFHHINVPCEVKQYFEGKNVRETIVDLMLNISEHPHISMGYERDCQIVFKLTYTENCVWTALSDLGESDRLRVLLY